MLRPWLSCAFDQSCMCITDFFSNFNCQSSPPRRYGRCHRFDQSSLGLILSKLLLDQRPIVYLPPGSVRVARNERLNWFEPGKGCAVLALAALCFSVDLLLWVCARSWRCADDYCARGGEGAWGCCVAVLVLELVVGGCFVWLFV